MQHLSLVVVSAVILQRLFFGGNFWQLFFCNYL